MNIEIKNINLAAFSPEIEEILSGLERTRCEFWNLDRESANFLNFLVKLNHSKNVLEIGTSNGYSGLWILDALSETNGKLTTIEFWEKRQSVARKNFAFCFPNVKVEPKIGSAVVVLEDLKEEIDKNKREKFDFVFIDANKKEYTSYFKFIDKMLIKGGVIVADNILSHYEKVEDYVNLLFDNKSYQSQIINIGTGMMLSRKKIN